MSTPRSQIRTIACRPDDEGEVVATLVSVLPEAEVAPATSAILYIHGFIDYFFQDHVAQRFNEAGYAFHALDLRKYGRSLLPHQHPNFCADVREYYEEITSALEMIVADGATDITLIGHSTGGLIISLYAAEGTRRDLVQRLILNSPFLEFNEPAFTRTVTFPAADLVGKYRPYGGLPKGLATLYGESLHQSKRGEWQYNLAWKPIAGFPVYWGWVRALHRAHKHLQAGLNVPVPVLLLHSDASASPAKWQENSMQADTVLNVADMLRYGPCIGPNVTLVEIDGGMHDIYLSAPPIRELALQVTLDWLDQLVSSHDSRTYEKSLP